MERNESSASSDSDNQVNKEDGEIEAPDTTPPTLRGRLVSICSAFLWFFWCLCTIALLTYIGFGLLVLYSREAKMEVIFSHRIRIPWFANLSDCSSFGLLKCENVVIQGTDGKLGAWLVSPSSRQYIIREVYILYLHGNMGSRAIPHRVKLYQKLSKMGYHILALDYRGFGDSEGFPTEEGLVEDSKAAYRWLSDRYAGFPVYIWGHSLGAAVGVQLAAWLNSAHFRLNGMILESPFNNMTDAILQTPLASPVVPLIPNFESYLSDVKNVFKSSYWIQKVTTPIKIFHDRSDHIINIALARRLFYSAKEVGSTNVDIIEFDEKLYHCDLHKAKKLKGIMSNFVYSTS